MIFSSMFTNVRRRTGQFFLGEAEPSLSEKHFDGTRKKTANLSWPKWYAETVYISSSSSCFCSHLKTELFCRAYGVDSP